MKCFDSSAHKEPLTADAVVSKVESITRMETDFPFSQLSTINCLSSRRVWFRARNLDWLRVDLFRPSPAFLARRAKGLLSEYPKRSSALRTTSTFFKGAGTRILLRDADVFRFGEKFRLRQAAFVSLRRQGLRRDRLRASRQ